MAATPIGQATFAMYTPTWIYPLLSDGDDVVSRSGTVASGIGVLKRGTILKIVFATGVITVPVAAADCNCILVDDIDATSATVPATVYVGGKFKADAIIWPGVLNHGDCTDALRNYDIQIESVVFTDGSLVKSSPTEAEAAEARKNLDRVRELAKEAKAAEEEKKDQPPPSDSPWAYMTDEEREKDADLSRRAMVQARTDFDQEHASEPEHPAQKPPQEPPKKQEPPEHHRK